MALRKYRKALRYLDVCWEKDDIDQGLSLHILALAIELTWNFSASSLLSKVFALSFLLCREQCFIKEDKISNLYQ